MVSLKTCQYFSFFFNDTATTEIYTLSLHDALPIYQVQRDVFGDRRQERRAATDDDRIAEDAQLVDEAELDRRRGQPGAADRNVLVGRVERGSGLLGHRRLSEPGVALDAFERATEDDLRDRAPHVG